MIDYSQIPDRLNERIRFIRNKHNYTQKEIAQHLSIDRATYAKYESGNRSIPIEAITGLAAVYSVSTDFILGVSANPEHINYNNFSTGLSDGAITNLQFMFKYYGKAFKALNSLLESKSAFMIFQSLGLLISTPTELNCDDLKCDKNLAQMILHMFHEASMAEFPVGIFGLSEEQSMEFGSINFEMLLESYLNIYLRGFIDKIRAMPETRRNFANELKNLYMYRANKELDELREAEE